MYTEILDHLCCPCCRRPLDLHHAKVEAGEIISGELSCQCGQSYPIREGIADFGSHEQDGLNSWSGYYEENSYEELDKRVESNRSEHQKWIESQFLRSITAETSRLSEGYLLDIASGRGILLRELLKTSAPNVHIISTDLSFQVLKYDRIKLKKQHPQSKVSFLACDAAELPIKSDSIDVACTYVGFVNMGNLAGRGIEGSARVLRPGAQLIDSCIYMDKEAAGYQHAAEIFMENGDAGAEQFFLKENLLPIHRKYFSSVTERIVYEGIAEAYPDDLIPCEGEWFADALIISQK